MNIETILAYLGIALGVIGLVASYYFYKRSLRIKEPVFSIKSNNLISGSTSIYDDLKVSYKRTKVENFTVSKILFFNRGSETLKKEDMLTANPIRIVGHNAILLDGRILQANHTSNNINLQLHAHPAPQIGMKYYVLDFDYLDKNQGAVIEILHTGLSSDDLTIEGDIMGVQKIVNISPKRLFTDMNSHLFNYFLIGSFMVMTLIIVILRSPSGFYELIKHNPFITFLFLFILALSAVLIIMISTEIIRLLTGNRAIPKGLDKFLE